MAILSFGSTFRAANTGFALTNTTANSIYLGAMGCNLPGLATKSFSLDVFDAYSRSPRHTQVDEVKLTSAGIGIYQDDYVYLCALIKAGTLLIKSTTYTASANTFTAGATAAFTTAGSSIFLA
jgi:hypothetical protein